MFCLPLLNFWGYFFKEHPLTSDMIYNYQNKSFAFLGTIFFYWVKQQLKCLCCNVRQVGFWYQQDECSGKKRKD